MAACQPVRRIFVTQLIHLETEPVGFVGQTLAFRSPPESAALPVCSAEPVYRCHAAVGDAAAAGDLVHLLDDFAVSAVRCCSTAAAMADEISLI